MAVDTDRINELIKSISEDNEAALEELFKITKETLFYVAKDYVYDASCVEDVLSEAYLKIYKKAHTFNRKYNGFNWLYEIVKNTALDFNKKHFKDETVAFDETYYICEDDYRDLLMHKQIKYAMRTLDKSEYQILYLRIWENKTLEYIAKKLKYSTTGVYRKYNEAIEKLRHALE